MRLSGRPLNAIAFVAVYGRVLRLALTALLGVMLCATAADAQAQRSSRRERIEQARELFIEGLQAYERGELHVAVRKLLASQRSWRNPDTAFNIARCFERMGEAPYAIRWFRIYLHHGRPDPQARADIEERIRLLEQLQQRQTGQVFAEPPSGDELTAEAATFFRRGVAMFQSGHLEAAMQAFTQAHRFAPFPELLYNMALTAERLDQLRDAIDYYREYLRLRPNAPDRMQVERRVRELREQRRSRR